MFHIHLIVVVSAGLVSRRLVLLKRPTSWDKL